jgi:VCBS repeat-containing protein
LAITLTTFDPDPGDVVVFQTTPVSGPSNGTATIAANGSFTYVPASVSRASTRSWSARAIREACARKARSR